MSELPKVILRIRQICDSWPVIMFREGRDFGYFVRTSYLKTLNTRFREDTHLSKAKQELEALKRLRTDVHKKNFPRKRNASYSDLPENHHILPLSTVVQELYNERLKPFWRRNEKKVALKYGTPEMSELLEEMGIHPKEKSLLGRIQEKLRLKGN